MTLWLTRITPDPSSAQARADFAGAGAIHRRLMSLLPPEELGGSPRQAAGLLFRMEETRRGSSILVQSARELDPSRLPDGYGSMERRELSPLLDALVAGHPVRYRIVANPTKRIGRSELRGVKEKTIPLRGSEAEDWWRRRAHEHGLEPRSLLSQDRPDATDGSRGRRIRHAAVLFQGVGTVVDTEALRAAVERGIGRGKSHGCGLLSLAPLEVS